MDTNLIREELVSALAWRYATKRFDSERKISESDWNALENALRMSPSSFGLQPWRFIVVKNAAVRNSLREHAWNQPQLVEASHLVVLAARTSVDTTYVDHYLKLVATERAIPVETLAPYRGMIVQFVENLTNVGQIEAWTTRQTYIALGSLLTAAALLRIDTCPLEGIDPQQFDAILGLPRQGYSTKVACALGYRSADDAAAGNKKVRYQRDAVFSVVE